MGERGIADWVAATPDKPAVVCGDEVRTFGALDDRAERLAAALAERGVGAGDRVAVLLPNSIEFVEAWLAAAKLGAQVVLVNWHLKSDELAYILEDSQARVLVAHADLRAQYEGALAQQMNGAGSSCTAIVVGDDYEQVIDGAVVDGVRHEVAVLAAPVFYTSGTTGRPKGVVHPGMAHEGAARFSMDAQVALWDWTEDDVNVMAGPAYHAGPGGYLMTALYVGATTVILPRFDAREWLRAVERHRATISFMVPAHFIRILEVPEDERSAFDLSSLRKIVHGAAPCPVSVKRGIIDALAPGEVWELYGASEGGATRIGPDEWLAHPGSVGLPWPGTEVHILDEDGAPRPVGEPGLVYITPTGGAQFHYHEDAEKTEGSRRDGAFTVGDVGYVDEDGYLYLTDRANDMVIRGGVNVYPREIEDVLHEHPAVVDCAVFGVPDERLGEQLKAVVEVRSATGPDELAQWCRDRLADFKVPAYVEIVPELPRHPNGKVLKRHLRDEHWKGQERNIG